MTTSYTPEWLQSTVDEARQEIDDAPTSSWPAWIRTRHFTEEEARSTSDDLEPPAKFE